MKSTTSAQKVNEVKAPTTILEKAELGEVKIHENVVAQLVKRAVLEIEGVSRLAGSTLVDDIATLVGSRRMQSRAITVELGEDGRVGIEIKLNLVFGFRIPDVAERVQKAVIGTVEETTGMTVTRVNVVIQEIEDPVVETEDDAMRKENITTILNLVANICNEAFDFGYLLRGAIVENEFFHNNIIVYGKALVEAVYLEEKVAKNACLNK